jgi:hypothetical protein
MEIVACRFTTSSRTAAWPKNCASSRRSAMLKPISCLSRSGPFGLCKNSAPLEMPAASSVAASTSRRAPSASLFRVRASATPLSSEICAACSVQRRVRSAFDVACLSSWRMTAWACSSRRCTSGSRVTARGPCSTAESSVSGKPFRSGVFCTRAVAPTRRASSRSASVSYQADASTTGRWASNGSFRISKQS